MPPERVPSPDPVEDEAAKSEPEPEVVSDEDPLPKSMRKVWVLFWSDTFGMSTLQLSQQLRFIVEK